MTVLWSGRVHTDNEGMTNRPDISKDKKEESMRTDRCGIVGVHKCYAKESREETCQEFMYRDTMNVEREMHYCTGSNWIHRNGIKMFKEKLGSHNRKTFIGFRKKDCFIRNITSYGNDCSLSGGNRFWFKRSTGRGWSVTRAK